MGCGSSKTESSSGPSGEIHAHAEPPKVNGDKFTSTFQMAPSNKLSEKESNEAPQESQANVTGLKTAEQRDSCVGTKTATKSTQMTILHFNDVYNIEPRDKEPVGGAARFATKLASYKHLNPLIVFSGDCLNPSTSEYACNVHNKLAVIAIKCCT